MTRLFNFIKNNWVRLTLLILTGITLLSLLPLKKLPSIPGADKTHHIIAYAVLMFPTAFRKPNNWILIGLLFIAYSGAIELLQPFVNRYGSWLDLAANAMGVICGIVIAELVNYLSPVIFNRSR